MPHARRKFFELADVKVTARKGKKVTEEISLVALEAVNRFDAIFEIERGVNGLDVQTRRDVRQDLVRPFVNDLHDRLRAERSRMPKQNQVAEAFKYIFDDDGRSEAFTRFLDDGRICITNNAAERAAFMYSLIVTAKMNYVDPQACLSHVLAKLPGTTSSGLPERLPCNCTAK